MYFNVLSSCHIYPPLNTSVGEDERKKERKKERKEGRKEGRKKERKKERKNKRKKDDHLLILSVSIFCTAVHYVLSSFLSTYPLCQFSLYTLLVFAGNYQFPGYVFSLPAGDPVWIGGFDIYSDNKYRWMDGHLVESSYTNWNPGDPGNGHEDYLGIRGDDGMWRDYSGTENFKYICESGLV